MSGKGSKPRPFNIDRNQFEENWNRIFRKNIMTPKLTESGIAVGSCGCGRSPSGKCIGWHGLTEQEYQRKLAEYVAEQKEDSQQ